jgi:hypothetical protein
MKVVFAAEKLPTQQFDALVERLISGEHKR